MIFLWIAAMLIKLYVWQLDDTHSGFKVERPKIHPVSKEEQSRYSKSRKTFIVIIHILFNQIDYAKYGIYRKLLCCFKQNVDPLVASNPRNPF